MRLPWKCFRPTHGENNGNATLSTIDCEYESNITASRATAKKPWNCEGSDKCSLSATHLTRTIDDFDLFGMPMIFAWDLQDQRKKQSRSSNVSRPSCESNSSLNCQKRRP